MIGLSVWPTTVHTHSLALTYSHTHIYTRARTTLTRPKCEQEMASKYFAWARTVEESEVVQHFSALAKELQVVSRPGRLACGGCVGGGMSVGVPLIKMKMTQPGAPRLLLREGRQRVLQLHRHRGRGRRGARRLPKGRHSILSVRCTPPCLFERDALHPQHDTHLTPTPTVPHP